MKPYQLLFWCLQRKLNISNTKSWGRQKLQWRTAVLCHSTVPSQKVVNDSGEWLNDTTGMKKKERKKEKKKDPTLLTHWRENVGALSKNVKARPFSIDRCRTSIWFFLQTWQGLPSCRANEMLSERGGAFCEVLWATTPLITSYQFARGTLPSAQQWPSVIGRHVSQRSNAAQRSLCCALKRYWRWRHLNQGYIWLRFYQSIVTLQVLPIIDGLVFVRFVELSAL